MKVASEDLEENLYLGSLTTESSNWNSTQNQRFSIFATHKIQMSSF